MCIDERHVALEMLYFPKIYDEKATYVNAHYEPNLCDRVKIGVRVVILMP